ncbi:MAG: hypothetical protein RBS39_11810 [Phycisphaerales bacterium]|jgi:hypothetical protein|nr:hypothetical protein [Phycisphaerales bacterium]
MIGSGRIRKVSLGAGVAAIVGACLVAGAIGAGVRQLRGPQATYVYPLDVCVVTGESLAEKKKPQVRKVDGREVRLCCGNCSSAFRKDPEKWWPKVDAAIIEAHRVHYPLTNCVVGGGPLGSMGEPVDHVVNNRLVRLCCAHCIGKIDSKSEAYFAKMDTDIADMQRAGYPSDACVIDGTPLPEGDKAVEVILANRLFRLCGEGCKKKLEERPWEAMAALDAAYAAKQRADYPMTTCVVDDVELPASGRVEVVAGDTLVEVCGDRCAAELRLHPERYVPKVREARKN